MRFLIFCCVNSYSLGFVVCQPLRRPISCRCVNSYSLGFVVFVFLCHLCTFMQCMHKFTLQSYALFSDRATFCIIFTTYFVLFADYSTFLCLFCHTHAAYTSCFLHTILVFLHTTLVFCIKTQAYRSNSFTDRPKNLCCIRAYVVSLFLYNLKNRPFFLQKQFVFYDFSCYLENSV